MNNDNIRYMDLKEEYAYIFTNDKKKTFTYDGYIPTYLVKGGKYKGFTLFMRDIFESIGLNHKIYYASCEVEVEGKTYCVFQNQSKKQKKNWFYFGTEFRASNFKNFMRRVKKFLKEKLKNIVTDIFDKVNKVIELSAGLNPLDKDYNIECQTKVKRINVKDDVVRMFFKNFNIKFVVDGTYFQMNVLYEAYKNMPTVFRKMGTIIMKSVEHLFPSREHVRFIIRPRPFL